MKEKRRMLYIGSVNLKRKEVGLISRKNKRVSPLKPGEIIPLNFDEQFNRILNNEKNIIILENFLSIYFERPLIDYKGKVKLKAREIMAENKQEHDKQVDLIVEIDGEKQILKRDINKA